MSLCQLHCVWNSRLFTYETCLHHLPLPSVSFIFVSGLHWTDRHRKALINLRNAFTCLLFVYIVFSRCASSALCFTSSSFFSCLASSASILITSFFDLFLSSQIYCIENAHGQLVRDLDFNPNRQYYLASCGDDCKVKFWDVRNVQEPVKVLEEHSHWWVDHKGKSLEVLEREIINSHIGRKLLCKSTMHTGKFITFLN